MALSIAGSDPGGGAGIQADLKTLHAHGVYALTVPTLITVQNTLGVSRVQVLPAELVQQQIEALLADFEVHAIKIGALGNAAVVDAVAEVLEPLHVPVVLDPVVLSSSGKPLLDSKGIERLKKRLLPLCTLLTPNLPELDVLFAGEVPLRGNVLVKGGHRQGETLTDVLWMEGQQVQAFAARRQPTRHLHGTGCTLSSAIAARLALGHPLPEAIQLAHGYLQQAIQKAPGLGTGSGPLGH